MHLANVYRTQLAGSAMQRCRDGIVIVTVAIVGQDVVQAPWKCLGLAQMSAAHCPKRVAHSKSHGPATIP